MQEDGTTATMQQQGGRTGSSFLTCQLLDAHAGLTFCLLLLLRLLLVKPCAALAPPPLLLLPQLLLLQGMHQQQGLPIRQSTNLPIPSISRSNIQSNTALGASGSAWQRYV